jgi:hypothetical protein
MRTVCFSLLALISLCTYSAAQGQEVDPATGLSAAEAAGGFKSIFDGKSLDGWVGLKDDTSSYYVKDGMLICTKEGIVHIFTQKEYANFILRLQIRLDPGGNNGIGIRTQVSPEPHIYGMEIQVLEELD